jgi:hypothetical protein
MGIIMSELNVALIWLKRLFISCSEGKIIPELHI